MYDAHAQLPADAVGTGFPEIATIVTLVQPPENAKHYIFAPAQPARFDVPITIYGNNTTSAWTQQSPLTAGERYQVISNLPTAMPKALEVIPLPSDNWAAPHETPYVEEEDDLERLWPGLRRLLLHILLRKIKNYK